MRKFFSKWANELQEAEAFRIIDGLAASVFTVIAFAVCYFGCLWLFPHGSRAVIAAVTGATALFSGISLFMAFRNQDKAE